MADAYEGVSRGSLKLKGVADGGVKKKKKKNKAKKVLEDVSHSVSKDGSEESQKEAPTQDARTPAQIAYDKIQEKRAAERILKKAEKTHKQRVEQFNDYLDGLTEHYDIPKVSWTK
ncbi:Protein fam32a [Desmophyllum pertusum]|uniref:Protein fam32a n=1 Tax=Desmophyllum pertusum TaxID=174260 RepID=A0A9W9ZS17_9CNID|nr:Protein fam32a [Desmophyllum pertusum]